MPAIDGDYAEQGRLQGVVAEPQHGTKALARLGDTLDKAGRVAAHYGLPGEHALALVTPHASRMARAQIAADTAIFEAMGGTITIVPTGKSAYPEPVLSQKSLAWLDGFSI